MAYELIGRLVVWGGKRYLRKRFGDKPRQVAAGVLVAGAGPELFALGAGSGREPVLKRP